MKAIKKTITTILISALCATGVFAAADTNKDWAALQTQLNGIKAENEDEEINIKLEKDYTAGSDDEGLVIPSFKNVTLDLNGHTIDRGLTNAENYASEGYVILVNNSYAHLTINDSSADKTGKITGGNGAFGGGIYVGYYSSLTLNDGSICGNKATLGGGIYIDGYASFTLNGGSICDNKALNGGGLEVYERSSFIMNGGSIVKNIAEYQGGGIDSSGNVSFPSIKIYGGTISGNTVTGEYGEGGGFYCEVDELEITGGTISGNNAVKGGGIFLDYGEYAENIIKFSGSPVIKDNVSGGTLNNGIYTGGTPSNVYLYTNAEYNMEIIISVTGTLSQTAEVHVSSDAKSHVITSGLSNGGQNAISHFHCDNSKYNIYSNSNGEAYLFNGVILSATEDPYNPGTYYTTFYHVNSECNYKADCEVYFAESMENGRFPLVQVEDKIIPFGKGVILKSNNELIALTATEDASTTNYSYSRLKGTTESITVTSDSGNPYYVLTTGENGVRFYKYTGTIEANKAYYRESPQH